MSTHFPQHVAPFLHANPHLRFSWYWLKPCSDNFLNWRAFFAILSARSSITFTPKSWNDPWHFRFLIMHWFLSAQCPASWNLVEISVTTILQNSFHTGEVTVLSGRTHKNNRKYLLLLKKPLCGNSNKKLHLYACQLWQTLSLISRHSPRTKISFYRNFSQFILRLIHDHLFCESKLKQKFVLFFILVGGPAWASTESLTRPDRWKELWTNILRKWRGNVRMQLQRGFSGGNWRVS